MVAVFEDLQVLRSAEELADAIWHDVIQWNAFARDTFGSQIVRAIDSVGANIAEAYGRFHYGEKLQFLYYARGSIFETKYWLNRARSRTTLPDQKVQDYASQLTTIARQLNAFAANIKGHRTAEPKSSSLLREASPEYHVFAEDDFSALFSDSEILWLEAFDDPFPEPPSAYTQ